MKIKIFDDYQQLVNDVAQMYVTLLNTKKDATLGLATGSTPIDVYQELINLYQKQAIDFSLVKTFNLDEYCGLDHNNPQSYYYFMQQHLFKDINVKPENIHFPSGTLAPDEACSLYQAELDAHQIDLQILGIGRNGHIAFNEPGTSFDAKTHIVDLDQKTIDDNARFFDHINEVPTKAITMGLADIMRAKTIILIALGKNKQEAVMKMINEAANPSLPASILQNHPNCYVFLDKEAGELLNV